MATASQSPESLIAERLADALGRRRLHQKDLAAHVGLSEAAVSKWVKGEAGKNWAKLAVICAFLEVPADEILGLKPPARPVLEGDGTPVCWCCPRCGANLVTTIAEV